MDQIIDPSSLEAGHIAYLRGIPAAVEALDMHGMADVVNALVVALLTEGHVLLEGNPGLGKTALVRALELMAAHEVAHLVHADHSPAYWSVVHRLVGDHRPFRQWLRDHGAALHAVGR